MSVFYNQYKNCPPAQTKYWKHFDVQVQLTDRPRLPYIQAVFDFMISYQPQVKTHPVPQRFFWRQLAWRQFFRSHLRARRPDQSRLKKKIPNLFLAFTSSVFFRSENMCCRQAAWSRWLLDKSAYIDQLVERGQWAGRQRELILLDLLTEANEQFMLRWAFTACIGTSHTGAILRIFVQKGSFWMEKWSRWMFFFLFLFSKVRTAFLS